MNDTEKNMKEQIIAVDLDGNPKILYFCDNKNFNEEFGVYLEKEKNDAENQ